MTIQESRLQKSYSFPQISNKKIVLPRPLSLTCSRIANKVLSNSDSSYSDSDRSDSALTQIKGRISQVYQQEQIAVQYGLTIDQIQTVQNYGLTLKDITSLKNLYSTVVCLNLLNSKSTKFFPRALNDIPFSIVLIPNACERKGLYALLKTHALLDRINVGTYSNVTWALNLNTFCLYAFRSAKLKHVSSTEQKINDFLSNYSHYFVTGDKVFYDGHWRKRLQKGGKTVTQKSVDKIGFLMDYEGKSLWEMLNDKKQIFNKEMVRKIAQKLAETVAFLHQLNIVHGDPKPENIFLSKDNKTIKLGDFGFSNIIGKNRFGAGTFGYMAPEIILSFEKKAVPENDIWGMGCVFAEMFRTEWTDWWRFISRQKNWRLMTYRILEEAKDEFLPERNDPAHPHYIIGKCLNFHPKSRPSALEIAIMWKNLRKMGSAV